MLWFLIYTGYTVLCLLVRGWVQYLCCFLYLFLMIFSMAIQSGPYSVGNKYERADKLRRWMDEVDTVGPTPMRFIRYLQVIYIFIILFVLVWFPIAITQFQIFPPWVLIMTYYGISIFLFCLYHPLEFLLIRLHTFQKLQKACAKNDYRFTGDLRKFLSSDRKNASAEDIPEILIETPEEILRVLVLGRPGMPMKYTFHRRGDSPTDVGYTVMVTGPIDKTMSENSYDNYIADAVFSDDPKDRRRSGKLKLYPFPAPVEEAAGRSGRAKPCENILLFCPEGMLCEDLAARKTVVVGGKLYGYTVYNARRFVRGRLGPRRREG